MVADNFWQWILVLFNTREIAAGLWLFVIVAFLLLSKKIRPKLFQLLRAAVQWKLLVMFGSLALYISSLCWSLSLVDLWTTDQIGSTTLWFFMSGIALLARSLSVKEDDPYFRTMVKDSIKVSAAFEFIVVANTFSLFVELLLVPAAAVLSIFLAVAQMKDEYRSAKLLIESIMAVFGCILLWHSISGILSDPAGFFTSQNGRNFLLPIFLTISSTPFFYLWYCISNLENASLRIKQNKSQPDSLKRYAMRHFFWSFSLKPWLLQRAVRQFQILPAKSLSDVSLIIQDIRVHEEHTLRPPPVDEQAGWSPYLARDYLKRYGLRTGDYHAIYDGGEWWASSSYIDLDENILPNKVAFYMKGQKELVTQLKLSGDFYTDADTNEALNKFLGIAVTLTAAALEISTDAAAALIPEDGLFEFTKDITRLSSRVEQYPTHKGFSWYFVLSRS